MSTQTELEEPEIEAVLPPIYQKEEKPAITNNHSTKNSKNIVPRNQKPKEKRRSKKKENITIFF